MALFSRISIKEALRRHRVLVEEIRRGTFSRKQYSHYLAAITKLLNRKDREKFHRRIQPIRDIEDLWSDGDT